MISAFVSLSTIMRAGCAKTAERIDVLFGVVIPGNPRNIVLNWGPHLLTARGRGFDAAFAKLVGSPPQKR